MITHWISEVPSKIVKLMDLHPVSAGRRPDWVAYVSTNSTPRYGPPGVQTPAGAFPACSAVAASAGEHLEAVGGGGAGGCGVGEQGRAGVGGELHGLEVEVMEADDQVMDALEASPVEAYVVGDPSGEPPRVRWRLPFLEG